MILKRQSIYSIPRNAVYLFSIALTISLGINIFFAYKNISRNKSPISPETYHLNPGDLVDTLHGKDLLGKDFNIMYGQDSRKVILLVFSPKCKFCDLNISTWQTLVEKIDKSSYNVIALSLVRTGAKEYLDKYNLGSVPLIVDVPANELKDYKIIGTPLTLLISSDGKIEKVWNGLIKSDAQKDVWTSLNIPI
jgi:peroxiredoxin